MASYETANYFVDDTDVKSKDVKQMMDHYYNSAYPSNASKWQQGSIDKRFKVGDQTLWSMVYGDNQYFQSRRFFFNLIRRHINMICGFQRKNRKSTVFIPTGDSGDDLCDDYNKVIRWCEDRAGSQEYFSQAFEGCVDVGETLIHIAPDYTHDPISGDLCDSVVSYNNYLIDPYYRKQDFSDCNFIWRRSWVSKECAKSKLPGMSKEIDKMSASGTKDGRFPLQAELINLDTNRLFTYDEFHYKDSREATVIIDPYSGEATEWEPDPGEPEDTIDRVMQEQPWLQKKIVRKATVKLAILLGGKVVYNGENLLKIDEFPFVPLLCYHEPDIQSYAWRVQGVVRNLRDAQYLYNRRKVIELDILESQISSGWIYPIDAVTDPKAFRQSGQGYLIPLKAGHLPGEVQRIEAPNIPASMIELSKSLAEDITKISGVNEELLGSATDDKAALLSMLRQGAGLTTLQTIFDKADYSQRLLGKIRLKAIQKLWSKGKIAAILGHEAHQRFFNASAIKYDVAVEEGCYSTTQRQMELQQKLYFQQIGIPIAPEDIIKSAFISDKKSIIDNMKAQGQQQQQMQQAQAQMQQQKDQAELMNSFAEARGKMADAHQSMTDSQAKQTQSVNDQQKTEYDNAQKELELVKLILELEDMDREGIRNALDLAEQIKNSVAQPPVNNMALAG
jgi:hypothetical protein